MSALKEKQAKIWKRDALDWYVEPERATEQLLSVERFVGPVWDPACGQGNIVKTLTRAGYEAFGSDIADRGFGGVQDFLDPDVDFVNVANIVTNPPYFRAKGSEAFIRRALSIATGKIAAFVGITFLAGDGRANGLFLDHPPTRVWVVTPRVSCPPGEYLAAGGKAEGDTRDWCWLVWDLTTPTTPTTIGWLRREGGQLEMADA